MGMGYSAATGGPYQFPSTSAEILLGHLQCLQTLRVNTMWVDNNNAPQNEVSWVKLEMQGTAGQWGAVGNPVKTSLDASTGQQVRIIGPLQMGIYRVSAKSDQGMMSQYCDPPVVVNVVTPCLQIDQPLTVVRGQMQGP
jgi:hypothetical protein